MQCIAKIVTIESESVYRPENANQNKRNDNTVHTTKATCPTIIAN